MKCVIPEISWHNREPVLCIDIHPVNTENDYRIATGGADYHILIWTGKVDQKGCVWVQVECDLTRHQKAVNALRWSPDGSMLASADDDGIIFIWIQKIDPAEPMKISYIVQKTLRGHKEDIYDLCWSPKSDKIFSGSIDNTAILWDVSKGKSDHIFTDHKGFVQGVCFDPKGQYVATLSSDRHCRIIDVLTKQVKSRIIKGTLPVPESNPLFNKEVKYFHDDTFKSYFRRFGFSPDGNLFITPSGFIETDDNKLNLKCAYLFTLDNQQPVGMFPFENSCTLAAKFSPILYELSQTGPKPIINLPYRMVFAIAAETDIFLYDTQQLYPFGRLKNVHYTRITDLSWSSDGRLLVASSSDGFCTLLSFLENEIGEIYYKEEREEEIIEEEKENSVLNVSGIEELEPMDIDQVKKDEKSESEEKKSTFLMEWAHKAKDKSKDISKDTIKETSKILYKENNKSDEKINVLTVRRKPRIQNDDIKTDEVIEVSDSPVKNDKNLNNFEIIKPKRVATRVNVIDDIKIGKHSENVKVKNSNKKPKQEITPNKKIKKDSVKSSPLFKFLKSPVEQPKIKPVLEDHEARDAWKCDGDKNNDVDLHPEKEVKQITADEITEITVPDLDLKLESSVSVPTLVVNECVTNEISQTLISELTEKDGSKRVPRRVKLITLSSPKSTNKKKLK